jgi:hypothetical protein
MPGGCGDFEDEVDESSAIPTASRQPQTGIELDRFDLRTSDVDRYDGQDGDNADADEEEEALQADDGSTQNLED